MSELERALDMDESEEIIAYVHKQKDGVSWTRLTKEFEQGRGWSHGKFVNHMEEAKTGLEKRLDPKGRPRYFAKKNEETSKIALKNDVSEQSLTQATIPGNIIGKGWQEYEERLFNYAIKNANLFTSLKLAKAEMRFFKECEIKEKVDRYRDAFRIDLMYPKGVLPPKIPEWAFPVLLQVLHASSASDSRLNDFRIILSYDSTGIKKPKYFDESSFVEWLKKFKHKELDSEMLHILSNEKMPDKKLVSVGEWKKYIEYREYQVEFAQKYGSYLRMTTELAEQAAQE